MTELIETQIADLIRRVGILESNNKTKYPFKGNPNRPATENQLIKLAEMGYDIREVKTHNDVSKAFEEIFKDKEKTVEKELNSNEEDVDLFPNY